jgi:hypothetical protein
MKKIFLASLLLGMGTFTAVQAATTPVVMAIVEAEETAVKPEELPAPVKEALSAEAFTDWEIAAATLVTEGDNAYYRIDLVKGEEKQVVKFDKEGKAL